MITYKGIELARYSDGIRYTTKGADGDVSSHGPFEFYRDAEADIDLRSRIADQLTVVERDTVEQIRRHASGYHEDGKFQATRDLLAILDRLTAKSTKP